jgi:colanic acid biosynthesis glycosyl transferase WcaI
LIPERAQSAGIRPRVLIVAINYAPELTGTAPYTTAMAEHLAKHNEVTVVAGMPHYPNWRIADGYAGRMFATERRNGVHIMRRGHYVPSRQTALQRAAYEATFVLSALTALPWVHRPDAILGVVPSLNGAVLARVFAARFRMPYGLIFQDLMGQAAAQTGIPGGGPVRRITSWLEGSAARQAALVATVADRFFPYLVERGVDPSRLVHLPNWTHIGPSTADREKTRASLGWGDGDFVVLHAGNMGLKQHLEQVIAAAAAMHVGPRERRVRFVLMGDGSQRRRLQSLAAGVPGISFMDSLADREYSDTLAAADLLLVSERPSATEMSLPSKLTSYFVAGRPVLAAVPPEGATAREVVRAGAGVVVPAGDTSAMLKAIAALAADPEGRARYSSGSQRYARSALQAEDALERADAFIERLTAASREPATS